MLENKSYYIKLYDCYHKLFTKTQKEYFESYFYDDLSLSEISENLDVSRAGISKQLKNIKMLLDMYEEKLELAKLYDTIDMICEDNQLSREEIITKLKLIGGE